MRKQTVAMIVIVLLLAGVVGFMTLRQDSDDSKTPVTSSTDVKTNDKSNDAPANTNESSNAEITEIEIENFAFSPETITVKKGTTITWTNRDSMAHTVTGNDGQGPDSELLDQGESYSYTFNEAGSFPYACKPHPNMQATVIVTE